MFDLLERFFAKFAKRSNNKGFSVIILLFWMNLDKLWTIGPFVGHPTVPPFMFIPNDLLLFSCLLIRMFLITVKGSEWDSKHFHTNHPNVETRDTRHLNLTKPSMSGKYLLPHQATTQSNHTKRPHQATTPSYHTKRSHQTTIPTTLLSMWHFFQLNELAKSISCWNWLQLEYRSTNRSSVGCWYWYVWYWWRQKQMR